MLRARGATAVADRAHSLFLRRLQGLPDVWAKALPAGISRDETVTTDLSPHVAPRPPPKKLRESMLAPGRKDSNISKPYNIQHQHHVRVDPRSSTGFVVRVWPLATATCSMPAHARERTGPAG